MDTETADVLAALSTPAPTDRCGMSRRRFLQAGAMTAGASALLPTWLADLAEAATPIGSDDGVLVAVQLGGGNDGLNTVVPTGDGAYYAKRPNIAIKATDALSIGTGVGLHPKLGYLKSRFDAGQLAVLQGVGDIAPDLSHFTATARWMTGDGTEGTTGWLGRYVDGLPGGSDPFHAVTVGTSVPLLLNGATQKATALPQQVDDGLSTSAKDDWVRRSAECLRAMGGTATGLGAWGDAIATAGRSSVDLNDRVHPLYTTKLAPGRLASPLDLAARIVNADLGVRVLHVSLGSFDHHANLPGEHAQRLAELDAGLQAFFATLAPKFANRVTVLTFSEFGRRVQANQSNGTDHGTASSLFALGARVRGGLYGAMPSLTNLDRSGNLVPTVDFRSVYATMLDLWLRADSRQLLGATFENLGFLNRPAA
ncbi:MAG: hypothetical protein JWO68_3689 [Actinomycetia bacterium]|nr:hypothetical protein [Actinomycetes bacterium]